MNNNQILELLPVGPEHGAPSDFCLLTPGSLRLFNPISAITSVIGGAIGSSAANSGAKVINTADQNAAQSAIDTTNSVNPNILATSTQAGTDVKNQAAVGAGLVNDATNAANANVTSTQGTGAAAVTGSAAAGAAGVAGATKTANDLLNPYAQSGEAANSTLQAGLATGGDFNKTPSLSDLQMDPGYAFRLQQGQAALDRSAAARGGVTSGGNIKAQTDFAQGSASQEYQNAFNRFETSTQNRYANLSGVANRGLSAGSTMGTNDINSATYGSNLNYNAAQYGATTANDAARFNSTNSINAGIFGANTGNTAAQYAGNANIAATNLTSQNTINAGNMASQYRVGGATAIAQGRMGAANAWTGALNGVGNAAMYGGMGNFSMRSMNPFSNPTSTWGDGSGSYGGPNAAPYGQPAW
jgi:hypothetical protein